jgi:hypothetical protein
MTKINLFFILAFKEQTFAYEKIIKHENNLIKLNKKDMQTTLSWHYIMLSKYFNLYNFYRYEDKILNFDNAIIYHLPYGKDDNHEDIESKLLKFKDKVPIVMRNYDAHSHIKLSKKYMQKYHDLCLSYLSAHINNKDILFSQISYDNFLVKKYYNKPKYQKFASMILRKEYRNGYFEESDKFIRIGLDLQKTYDKREEFAKYKQIDIYGGNWPWNMENYKGFLKHKFKYKIQNKYKFNFIIENAVVDNYISEKILDSFVSLSVPVYFGSPMIDKYIPKECFINIKDFQNNDELLNYLENMDDDIYNKYIKNILKYRNEIFEKFSTKNNFAKPVYKWYKKNINPNLEYDESFFDKEEEKIVNLKYIENNLLKDKLSNLKQNLKLFWYQTIR